MGTRVTRGAKVASQSLGAERAAEGKMGEIGVSAHGLDLIPKS